MHYLNSKLTILFRLVFGILIIAQIFFGWTRFEVKAQTISAQLDQINKQLSSINVDFHNASSRKETLDAELAAINQDLATTEQIILDLNKISVELEAEIASNEEALKRLNASSRSLLVELQKQSQVSPIQSLFSSKNLGEVMGRLYSLNNVENKVSNLEMEILEINTKMKEDLERQKKAAEQAELSKGLLASKKDDLEFLVSTYKGQQAKYAAERQALISQQKELEDRASKNATGGGAVDTGGSGSPTGVGPIGCWFEDKGNPGIPAGYFLKPVTGTPSRGFSCIHDGVDIPGSRGTPIKAAAAGTVVRRGWYSDGYGNSLVIRHTLPNGGKVYTLYAHMNSAATKGVGGSYAKGEVLGYRGTTGYSTGYHLHFMIMTSSYEAGGVGCKNNYSGVTKCLRPERFLGF